MTANDIDVLKIYVLLSPILVGLVGLTAVWLGRWMDRREERHKAH
jgi:hypothetical protein